MANSGPFYAPGNYRGEITDTALTKSANKGTPEFVIKFRVIAYDDGQAVDQAYQREIHLYITSGTIPYFLEKLETLGYTRDSFDGLDASRANSHNFVGLEFDAYCKHEAGTGQNASKLFEKWDVSSGGGNTKLEAEPLETSAVRELNNLFGRSMKEKFGGMRAPQPQAVAQARSAISDDDLPF